VIREDIKPDVETGFDQEITMFTTKQLHQKPVINVVDGKRLGAIDDLYLDKALSKVTAVYLGAQGYITRRSYIIDLESVQVCGSDAWLVAGGDKAIELQAYPDAECIVLASSVRGREVQTEGGTKIGTIDDVLLDDQAQVVGFSLSRVYVRGPLADSRQIARSAMVNAGDKGQPMTVALERAESTVIAQS
jgi:uncharacterized protein YrrD